MFPHLRYCHRIAYTSAIIRPMLGVLSTSSPPVTSSGACASVRLRTGDCQQLPANGCPTVRRSFKFRLRPTRKQEAALDACLEDTRQLYNAALEERREAWRMGRHRVTFYSQDAQLKEIRANDPERYGRWAFNCERAAIRRLDRAFQGFFRRVKAREKPGYPRFKGRGWWDSIEWPENGGARWDSVPHPAVTRVYLRGVGHVRVHQHRAVKGRVKTITAKRDLARKKRGSNRRKKAVAKVAKLHGKARRQRLDHAHKTALALVRDHDLIVHEDLQITNMARRPKPRPDGNGGHQPNGAAAKAGLNKSIQDAGWGIFLRILSAKAESARRTVIAVDPRHTSQRCAECGHAAAGNRITQAEFRCLACGHQAHADVNAARNILRAGLAQQEA